MRTTTWLSDQNELCDSFFTLDSALANDGELITRSGISCLVKAKVNQGVYYIKIYTKAGKYLR